MKNYYTCIYCDRRYNEKKTLHRHLRYLHKILPQDSPPAPSPSVNAIIEEVIIELSSDEDSPENVKQEEGSDKEKVSENGQMSVREGGASERERSDHGTNFTDILDSSISVNTRCVVTSSQDLAHTLVAVTTTSALHSLERQTVTVSSGTHQQAQTIGTFANVVTSNQLTGGTILAQSVPQTSMPQRIVLNSGMSDVFLPLSPSTGASDSSTQFMLLESASGLVPSSDVTKVHSYSLPSAAVSALSSSCNMQKVVISTQGKHLQGTGLPHKAILTTPAHTQIGTGTKRLASVASSQSNTLSSVNTITDIVSWFADVNKLLSDLRSSSDGRLSSFPGSPKSKKMKLDKQLIAKDISKRKKIMDHFTKKLRLLKFKYYLQQAEYFFLKSGMECLGTDCLVSKKKLPTKLLEYLMSNKFDSYDDKEEILECLSRGCAIAITASEKSVQKEEQKVSNAETSMKSDKTYLRRSLRNRKSHVESEKLATKQNVKSDVKNQKSATKKNAETDVQSEKSATKQNVLRKLPLRRNKDAPDIPDLKPKMFWSNGVGEGQCCKLGDIPQIRGQINKAKDVRNLYRLLFFQYPTNGPDIVENILEFNGFTFDKTSDEYSKRQSLMKTMSAKTIFQMCNLLDIRKGDKLLSINNILEFLLNPSARIDPATDPTLQPFVLLERIKIGSDAQNSRAQSAYSDEEEQESVNADARSERSERSRSRGNASRSEGEGGHSSDHEQQNDSDKGSTQQESDVESEAQQSDASEAHESDTSYAEVQHSENESEHVASDAEQGLQSGSEYQSPRSGSPARSGSGSPVHSSSPAHSQSSSPVRSQSGSSARSQSGSPACSQSGSPARSQSGSPAWSQSGSEREADLRNEQETMSNNKSEIASDREMASDAEREQTSDNEQVAASDEEHSVHHKSDEDHKHQYRKGYQACLSETMEFLKDVKKPWRGIDLIRRLQRHYDNLSGEKSVQKEQQKVSNAETSTESDKSYLSRSLRNRMSDVDSEKSATKQNVKSDVKNQKSGTKRNAETDVQSEKSATKQNVLRKLTLRRNNDAPDIPDLKPKVFWLNGVGEGQGCKLGNIPEIRRRIQKSENIQELYRLLFFQYPTNGQDAVGDILNFNGFPFDKFSYEYSKLQRIMNMMPKKDIFQMCDLLDIRKGNKHLCIKEMLDFLLNPSERIDPATDPRWQPIVLLERIKIVSLKQSEEDDDDDEDIDMGMLLDEEDDSDDSEEEEQKSPQKKQNQINSLQTKQIPENKTPSKKEKTPAKTSQATVSPKKAKKEKPID